MSILSTFRSSNTEREEKARADLDTELLECISKGLAHFGDCVPEAILYNLKWMSKLDLADIPHKPEELERSLDRIFGLGSDFIKKAIIDEINVKFGLTQDYSNLKEAFETVSQKTACEAF